MPVRHTADSAFLLLRSPKASEGQGGALGEAEALKRGNTVGVRDQVLDLVAGQGLKVSRVADNDLLPTPAVAHLRNHDEPIEDYLQRRQDFVDGKTKGMPGASLGVAVRLVEDGLDWKDALMPTPTTRDYKDGSAEHERDGVVQTDTVARAIFNSGEIQLFGTVTTTTSGRSAAFRGNGTSVVEFAEEIAEQLNTVEPALLPTTTTFDWKGANNSGSGTTSSVGLATKIDNLPETSWGKFEPAIRRWEKILGRPAPAPTKPDGRDGAHRLSSEFTEWMMGLPAGWVTDCGLTRNEELKACGNGVVPQQAELALRILLQGINFKSVGGGQVNLPTPTVSDIFTDNLSSTQQKEGSMHSVTLPQAVRMVAGVEETN